MSDFDAVDGSPPTASTVRICGSDGTTTMVILAFTERLLLAITGRQRRSQITTGLHPKAAVV
jgi:hypothetical protein